MSIVTQGLGSPSSYLFVGGFGDFGGQPPEVVYTIKLVPDFFVPQSGEGNLDTSIFNGKSLQRTAYIGVYNEAKKATITYEEPDGSSFTNKIQTITDYLPVVRND